MMLNKSSVLIVGLLLAAGPLAAQENGGQAASRTLPSASAQRGAAGGGASAAASGATPVPGAQTGQNRPIDQVDLLDIYQRAVQNDPTIREAEATYLANSQVRPLARARLLPSLQVSASTTGSSSTNPNPPTNFITGEPQPGFTSTDVSQNQTSYSLSLSETIFDWSRYVGLKQADKQVAEAETKYEAAKQDLMVRVAQAYFNVLGAQDTLAAQIAAREALSQQLEQAQRRYEVGLIAITDVQQTQASYDKAVADVISAQQALALSQEQLREIIGENVSNLAGPAGQLPLATPNPAKPEAWVASALKENPQLIAARIAADIAQDDITIARAARLPTLSLSTGYSNQTGSANRTLNGTNGFSTHSLQGSYGYQWQLNLTVPLWQGGQISSTVQQRVYQHRASIEESERVARQTERETRDAYLGVISSISSVKALRQAQESAQTALRATEAGYQVGTQTSVNVIIAQENLRQAQTAYAQSRYKYLVNILLLKQAAGSLSIDDMQQINGWLGGASQSATPAAGGGQAGAPAGGVNSAPGSGR